MDPNVPFVVFVGRVTRQKGICFARRRAATTIKNVKRRTNRPLRRRARHARDRSRNEPPSSWHREAEREGDLDRTNGAAEADGPAPHPRGRLRVPPFTSRSASSTSRPWPARPPSSPPPSAASRAVDHGETGYLSREPRDGTRDPVDPARFAADIAERVNELLADPERAARMGTAGRARAIERFSWPAIASETVALYRGLVEAAG